MRAAYASAIDPTDPLAGLTVGDLPEPETPDDWVRIEVKASSLNHHDLWSLRGVGLSADQLPMVLGCDAAGLDSDGNPVLIHAVIGDPTAGDETMDPKRTLLSEKWPGTIAETVRVPRRNVIPKPPELSFAEAACLPTAWLTAYRMLRVRGRLPEGGSVLVQGAGGGVATAAVVLAQALGARVYATSRDAGKRERIAELGATAVEPGARLPERVDVVIETVGEATFDHSLKCAKPGARIVVSGATSGFFPQVDGLEYDLDQPLPPVAIGHGTLDPIIGVEWGRQAKELLQDAGADVLYREYPLPHTVDPSFLAELRPWLEQAIPPAG